MQLKRDTEYALRILYCIGAQCPEKDAVQRGLTVGEICARSGVPKLGVRRLCAILTGAQFLVCRTRENGDVFYLPGQDLRQTSLLQVVRITEPGTQLFAVFEKGSAFYKSTAIALQTCQTEVEKILSGVTIGSLLQAESGAVGGMR